MGKSSGQIVLITLLVLTIATTVALSLIARTTTDTTITNNLEESSRAFSAAEAGIEEALLSGVGSGGTKVLTGSTATYNVTVATIGGAAGIFEFPQKTIIGETETLWLVNHDSSGALIESPMYTSSYIDVCWTAETTTPAIVATLLYKESSDGSYRVAKGAYDPDGTRRSGNSFSAPTAVTGGCGGTTGTTYRQRITFSSMSSSINPSADTLLALRLRTVYYDSKFAIDTGGQVLALQGKKIDSTGATGGTNRKIVVYQQYRSAPTIFDSVMYGNSIAK